MLHEGLNTIDGITVEVVRRRLRRINIRVSGDGAVRLSIPTRGSSLKAGEAFLRDKWAWVVKSRAKALSRPRPAPAAPLTEAEIASFRILLGELNALWAERTGEADVAWRMRRVKSFWGCCHWRSRYITYNAELARAPLEIVDYVVAHEFAHFAVHNHGPKFHALMDARLPGWQVLRRRLNKREWGG